MPADPHRPAARNTRYRHIARPDRRLADRRPTRVAVDQTRHGSRARHRRILRHKQRPRALLVRTDRKSGGWGKRVSVRVGLGGRRIIKKKTDRTIKNKE